MAAVRMPSLENSSRLFGSAHPDVALALKDLEYHHPISLLPLASQQILTFGIVLADPLRAALDEPLDIGGVEGQAEVEDLPVVAMVIAYGLPALRSHQRSLPS